MNFGEYLRFLSFARLLFKVVWKDIWLWSMLATDDIVLWLLSRKSPVSAHTEMKKRKKRKILEWTINYKWILSSGKNVFFFKIHNKSRIHPRNSFFYFYYRFSIKIFTNSNLVCLPFLVCGRYYRSDSDKLISYYSVTDVNQIKGLRWSVNRKITAHPSHFIDHIWIKYLRVFKLQK